MSTELFDRRCCNTNASTSCMSTCRHWCRVCHFVCPCTCLRERHTVTTGLKVARKCVTCSRQCYERHTHVPTPTHRSNTRTRAARMTYQADKLAAGIVNGGAEISVHTACTHMGEVSKTKSILFIDAIRFVQKTNTKMLEN